MSLLPEEEFVKNMGNAVDGFIAGMKKVDNDRKIADKLADVMDRTWCKSCEKYESGCTPDQIFNCTVLFTDMIGKV